MKTTLLLSSFIVGTFAMAGANGESSPSWVEVNNGDALANAVENEAGFIRIASDFEANYDEIILISEDCQIDLNGHKVTFSSHGIGVIRYANVIVSDKSENGNGEMTITNRHPMFLLQNQGSFLLESGTYTTTDLGSVLEIGKYIDNVYIQGGRINASRAGRAVYNKGYVYMSGGTIVGGNNGAEPVINEIEGVFTLTGGAVYAGNNTLSRCFENVIWGSDDDMEIAKTILPEGVIDGGAVVLDEQWAIPDTYWLNYNLPEGTQIQPNLTHYYSKGETVNLPECNYKNYTPFGGWTTSQNDTENVFMTITAQNEGNHQLYPIWKYTNLPEDVTPDLIPESVSPEEGSKLENLSSVILSYGEGDYYVNEDAEDFGGLYNLLTGVRVCDIASISTYWDGEITVNLAETVSSNGSYELRINVASFGNDDWHYDDMESGRCNPTLFYRYTIYNAPTGATNCITNPDNGATVKELNEIYFTFPDEEMALYNYDIEAVITNEAGEEVMVVDSTNVEYTDDDNMLLLTLPEPITTNGIYKLSIPQGFFSFDWWERDASELTFTWIINNNVGVETIKTEERENRIYDLNGNRIMNTNNLRGIYIVNGKKVIFK